MQLTIRLARAAFAVTTLAAGLGVALAAARQAPEQVAIQGPEPLIADASPVRTCESLTSVSLPDTTIEDAAVEAGDGGAPPSCRVTAVVTHPPAGDEVRIWIGLPLEGWNGRFQGVGGGGFSGGSANGVRRPLASGFAAGSTDTGHEGGSGSFALDERGRLNWQLIRDNAYLGIHDMTVTGKALAEAFYGTPPARSYFNGCSTGGRQGLMEAQRYPSDYDGIFAGAPAINWSELHIEQLWGHVVMKELGHVVSQCALGAATEAAVAACDGMDGVEDGVIEDPRRCEYDPEALVGTTPGDCGTITEFDAEVIRRIWEGPRRRDGSFLWYGLPRGASFSGLTNTGGTPLVGRPNRITLDYWRFFLKQDPDWDWSSVGYGAYEQAWAQSVEQYSLVLGTNDPDLSAFRDHGGKIVMWHGQIDPLIYPGGSIDYFERAQDTMGAEETAEFMRFFLAPGVGHCGGGPGAAPSGGLEAMMRWVEDGVAPETLEGVRRDQNGTVLRTRPLCQHPLVARYDGTGDPDDAGSYECAADF